MPASLLIKASEEQRELECGPIVTIGRVPPNDITFPDDMKVSRNHAMIRMMGNGTYYLIDIGSVNGTFVNENRVLMPFELKDSDRIIIGDSILIFRFSPDITEKNKKVDTTEQMTIRATGAVKKITILVADIRNFTAMNEKVATDSLAEILSSLFQAATQIIEKHGGVVDKFIGDAVMARWTDGSRLVPDSIKKTLRAVSDIGKYIDDLNKEYPDLPYPLQMGFGINSGDAMVGNIGVYGQRDHTAIGDSVNIAFRLESASKELKKDVVIGKSSYDCLPEKIWEGRQQMITVKGKSEPIPVAVLTLAELENMDLN